MRTSGTLYELAGKRTVMDFLTGVSSQYERFRTFLNLGDRDNLLRLYNDHIKIWSCISSRDYEGLSDVVSHHIYDGFNASTEIISRHPDYFCPFH